MSQHPLIDRLDRLQQRIDAQPSMVPAIGVPPAGRQGHEGPPGHSSKAPVFFCGTGVGLLRPEKSPNPKSDSLSREQEPVGFALADPEIRRLAHAGHYDLRGSLSPHLFLGCGCVVFKDGRRDGSRCEASLPDETRWVGCGCLKTDHHPEAQCANLLRSLPEPQNSSEPPATRRAVIIVGGFRDPPPVTWKERWVPTEPYDLHAHSMGACQACGKALTIGTGWAALKVDGGLVVRYCRSCAPPVPYETHEEWVARLEAAASDPHARYLSLPTLRIESEQATAALPLVPRLAAKCGYCREPLKRDDAGLLMACDCDRTALWCFRCNAERLKPDATGLYSTWCEKCLAGRDRAEAASNLAVKVEARRETLFDQMNAARSAMMKPVTHLAPARQTPPAGRGFTFRMPEYVPEEGEWLTERGRRELQERLASGPAQTVDQMTRVAADAELFWSYPGYLKLPKPAPEKALEGQALRAKLDATTPRQFPYWYPITAALEKAGSAMQKKLDQAVDEVMNHGNCEGFDDLFGSPPPTIAALGTVAGHTFEGVGSDGRCACGRYREDLRPRNREWIGRHGHAHVGELTEHEYRQIEEMFTEEERIWSHVEGVSSGR